jgi:signal transduction histidine kinase
MIEALALALAMGLSAVIVFFGRRSVLTDMALGPYLLFPPLIWASFRFGPRVVVSSSLFAAIVAICGTALGFGPFATGSLAERLLPLQAFMTILSATGLLLGAAVSERRRAEAEAREAVRARDEFLSIASHELKTPLTSLQLQLESLAGKLKASPSLSTTFLTKMQIILRQSHRLAELIDELLDISRITSRRLDLQLEEVDLAALVREVAARAEEGLSQAGSRLELDVEGPVWGSWDKQRLHQVVDNLVSNAIKYGAGKPIAISLKANSGTAVLKVRDQGIGIAPEDQARIFQRFVRAVSPHHYGGFGLGLWIARQIVERLGGGIEVTSRPNEGSTFTVALPRKSKGTLLENGASRASAPAPPSLVP